MSYANFLTQTNKISGRVFNENLTWDLYFKFPWISTFIKDGKLGVQFFRNLIQWDLRIWLELHLPWVLFWEKHVLMAWLWVSLGISKVFLGPLFIELRSCFISLNQLLIMTDSFIHKKFHIILKIFAIVFYKTAVYHQIERDQSQLLFLVLQIKFLKFL